MRNKLWKLAVGKHPEAEILTRWLIVVRALLYPMDTFYWKMSEGRGYQWRTRTWIIHGVHYHDDALRALAKAQGETYRITRTGKCVNLERLEALKNVDDLRIMGNKNSN